ncbi:transcription factor TFIIF complex subunit Tfg3 [Hypoxylon texense]
MEHTKQSPAVTQKQVLGSDTEAEADISSRSATSVTTTETPELDAKATKRLLRKIDRHILPIMCTICLLCFLDRANIGNARLDNLEQDLHLVGLQYNDCLAVLFPFYIAAEIPSNIMMKVSLAYVSKTTATPIV